MTDNTGKYIMYIIFTYNQSKIRIRDSKKKLFNYKIKNVIFIRLLMLDNSLEKQLLG